MVSYHICFYYVIPFLHLLSLFYQNVFTCIQFFGNFEEIHKFLFLTRDYCNETCDNINKLLDSTNKLSTFTKFNNSLISTRDTLMLYSKKIDGIKPYSCDLCDHKSARKSDLKKHVVTNML